MVAQIDATYVRTRPGRAVARLLSYSMFEGRPLTTRGQWINPLLLKFFGFAATWPQCRNVEKPVFVLGTGRSGTTVLGVVLSMHRDVGFLNEPKALWHAIFPDEDLIGSYSRGPASYRLGAEDVSAAMRQRAHRLYGAYLAATGNSRVVDKYPELVFRVPFVKALFPDAQFVFLIRNGWDTCYSIEQWSDRLGVQSNGEVHDWWGVNRRKWNLLVEQVLPGHPDLLPHQSVIAGYTRQTDMGAVEWILTMREGLKILQDYPGAVIPVRFEEMASQPASVLQTLAAELGLAPDPCFLRYGKQTLQPVPPVSPFELAPEIRAAFASTMQSLGYAC